MEAEEASCRSGWRAEDHGGGGRAFGRGRRVWSLDWRGVGFWRGRCNGCGEQLTSVWQQEEDVDWVDGFL